MDDDGWVEYDALADPSEGHTSRKALIQYLVYLKELDLAALEGSEKLATLINAYNAFTLEMIVQSYDGGKLQSVREIADGNPWDNMRWILGGKTISLNQIEHEMIRKEFPDEPRIHWALVCAAYSCPPLRNEAYTADRLDEQLAEQEEYVLNLDHPRYVQRRNGELSVTPLFDWYGKDFNGGNWKAYVLKRIDATENEFGAFLDYDWRLNSQANRPE